MLPSLHVSLTFAASMIVLDLVVFVFSFAIALFFAIVVISGPSTSLLRKSQVFQVSAIASNSCVSHARRYLIVEVFLIDAVRCGLLFRSPSSSSFPSSPSSTSGWVDSLCCCRCVCNRVLRSLCHRRRQCSCRPRRFFFWPRPMSKVAHLQVVMSMLSTFKAPASRCCRHRRYLGLLKKCLR